MSTTIQLTAQAIFDEAFPSWRPKRSDEYRSGVLRQLRYRMMEAADAKCHYAAGSVQSDAYWAGVSEAWNLIEKHGCNYRSDERPPMSEQARPMPTGFAGQLFRDAADAARKL